MRAPFWTKPLPVPSSAMRRRCGAVSRYLVGRTAADELMVTASIFDHAKRRRSFEIVAEVHGATTGNQP